MKTKHVLFNEKPKQPEIIMWKLSLNHNNMPQLLFSGNGGNHFTRVFSLYKNGKWGTDSAIVYDYPHVFAKRKRTVNSTDRLICMWDEKAEGE